MVGLLAPVGFVAVLLAEVVRLITFIELAVLLRMLEPVVRFKLVDIELVAVVVSTVGLIVIRDVIGVVLVVVVVVV